MADQLTATKPAFPPPGDTALLPPAPPALFRTDQREDLEDAAALGFTHALLPDPGLLPDALAAGLVPVLELDRAAPESLAAFIAAGAAGFLVRQAHTMPPAALAAMLDGARAARPDLLFIAGLFGAAPHQAAALEGAGFNFATSSSCYWDFSSAWLNEDTDRTARVAPPVAYAAPPDARGWEDAAARRALRFSAMFAPAWVVDRALLFAPGLELVEELRALLTLRRTTPALHAQEAARLVSSPGAALAVLRRADFVAIANPSLARPALAAAGTVLPALALGALQPADAEPVTPQAHITLPPAGVEFFTAMDTAAITLPAPKLDVDAPRLAIEAISPAVDEGRYPARRTLGELVAVEADLLADGHDKLAGEVLYRHGREKPWRAVPLAPLGNDRWRAHIPLERLGRVNFVVTAWKDRYGTFADELTKKHNAGLNTALELREGLLLVEEAAKAQPRLKKLLKQLRELPEPELRDTLLAEKMIAVMRAALPRAHLVKSAEIPLDAEPLGASFASWYEVFPRSQSGDETRHGTFDDVIRQLPRIAGMGFDVLYFPPIHPIGRKNRKGRNNTLTPGPDDPGSPYAIGSEEGGHDAVHPQLGTIEDFRALVHAAKAHKLDIAIDFAIQCAPDHPWLKDHKGWFDWRPDGSLRYAENPPKKYEDIVNVDFYADDAKPSLWLALRDVVQFWVDQGVRYFRVDNPHTKPFPFWEWLIADIRSRHPDAIFLAEAFTRPKLMYRLAKIGFSQSYTYFTWRNTKAELTAYLQELSTTAPRDFFRPHFFVNTPDINPVFLQNAGRGGHLIRAALAATLSGLFGVYNGFELCEATPVPGKEEYLDSEKYQLRAWDYQRPGNIVAEITALNRVRRENAALHSHLNIEFLPCDNDQVLYFRKHAADGNHLLIAISLDPQSAQQATIELPLWRFNLPDDGALAAHDLIRGAEFTWHGKFQPVRLDPTELPFCIWRVGPAMRTA